MRVARGYSRRSAYRNRGVPSTRRGSTRSRRRGLQIDTRSVSARKPSRNEQVHAGELTTGLAPLERGDAGAVLGQSPAVTRGSSGRERLLPALIEYDSTTERQMDLDAFTMMDARAAI